MHQAIDLALQVKREHKQDGMNVQSEIESIRKFGKLIRGSSLNLKGLVDIVEQDQEQEPLL